jgi:hypothetical protein
VSLPPWAKPVPTLSRISETVLAPGTIMPLRLVAQSAVATE